MQNQRSPFSIHSDKQVFGVLAKDQHAGSVRTNKFPKGHYFE
jgi:hypothetical protein